MKTVQSSTLFLNKNSLFRLQSVVGCLFTGDKMRDLNRIKKLIPRISNEELKEFDQMYDDLSLVDSSYLLMWRPLPLPWSINMRRTVRLLNGDTDVSVEEDAVQLNTDGGLLLSAEKEYSEMTST